MDPNLNPFDLLGMTLDSTPADVRKAFSRLSLLVHPDKGGDARDMHVVKCAYDYVNRQLKYAATSGKTKDELTSSTLVEELEQSFRDFCLKQESDSAPTSEAVAAFHEMWEREHGRNTNPLWPVTYEGGYPAESAESAESTESSVESAPWNPASVYDRCLPINAITEVIAYKDPDPRRADSTAAHAAAPITPDALRCSQHDYGDGAGLTDYKYAYATFRMQEHRTMHDTLPSVEDLYRTRQSEIDVTA